MKKKKPEVITRPGEEFPPAGLLANHPREELFADVARQFEQLEQPLSLAWMQQRAVSLEELQALSAKIAIILRGYCALAPRDRIAFITRGLANTPTEEKPTETVLGARHEDASQTDQSGPQSPE